MIDEYNLYDLKDKFIGTYDVFKIADILGVEPENVLSIYEAGGKYKKYRIAMGRFWRWHINFCPGWKAYFTSLPADQQQALREKYQFTKYQ